MQLSFGREFSESELSTYKQDESFVNANIRYSFNGHMFGNLNQYNGLLLSKDSIIRWNVFNINSNNNIQQESIQWDLNQVYNSKGTKFDSLTLNSPGYITIDMNPTEEYISSNLFIYNLDETKQSSGMIAMYQVIDDNYESKTNSNNDSASNSSKAFFIFVIICSIIATLVLLYYNFYQSGHLSNVRDMSPILLESSHHFPTQSQQTSNIELSSQDKNSNDLNNNKKITNQVKHAEI